MREVNRRLNKSKERRLSVKHADSIAKPVQMRFLFMHS